MLPKSHDFVLAVFRVKPGDDKDVVDCETDVTCVVLAIAARNVVCQ
jgi:hypothetical protein